MKLSEMKQLGGMINTSGNRKWYKIEGSVTDTPRSEIEGLTMEGIIPDEYLEVPLTREDREQLAEELEIYSSANKKFYTWHGINKEIQGFYSTVKKTMRIEGKPTTVYIIEER